MAQLQDPAATNLHKHTTTTRTKQNQKNMKRKSSTLLLTNATEEDALRLAVSAADGAAVLAAASDHHLHMARTAVEAALHLSRARRRLGLHEFCFHVTLTSPAAAPAEEDDWAQGLDDAAMQEAFADVGLVAAGEERERSRLGRPEEGGEEEEEEGGACHADLGRQAGLLEGGAAGAGVASTRERKCPAEARQHGQQQREEPKLRSCFRAYERPLKTGLLEYSNLTESGDTVSGWAASRPGVVLPQDRLGLVVGKEAGLGGVGNRQPPTMPDCGSQKKLHGKPPCQTSVSSSGSCPLKRPRVVCSSVVPCTPATASSCAAPKTCDPTGIITRQDATTAVDDSCPGEDHQSPGQDGVDNVPPSDPSGGVLGGKASDDHPSLQMVSNSTASQSLGLLLRAVDIMASRKASFATRFGNDLPDEAPFVQGVDNPFLPDSENASESPPLVWPRCKKSRLWAFRVDDSESTQDVADKSPNNNSSSPGDSYALVWPRSTKSRMRTCGVIDSQSTQGLTAQGPVTDMSLLFVSRTTDKRESPSHLHPCSKKPRLEGGTEVQPLSRQPQAGTKEEEGEDVSVLKNRSWINGEAGGHVDCLERHLTTVACEEVAVGAKTPVLPHPKLASAALQTYFRRNKWQRTGNHCISRKKQPAVVGQPRQLFKGLRFLLTGFRRTREDDISSRIKQHGGSVLSEVPPPSVLEAKLLRETAGARMKLPIVVASNQVRTAKFLYACAIGCPPLKADWISSSISKNRCLPTRSYELIPCVQSPKGLDGDGGSSLIFQGLRVLLHGQSSFRSRFSALVEHGGGRVLRSIRSLKQSPGAVSRKLVLVVAENCEGFHATHKRAALRFNLTIVPAEWLVQSLLLQRLLPLPFEDVSVKQKPAALLSPKLDPLSNVFVVRKKRSTLVRNKSSMPTVAQATLEHQPPRQLCKELCISSSPIPAAQLSMMGVALSSEECTNHATSENKLVLEPCQ